MPPFVDAYVPLGTFFHRRKPSPFSFLTVSPRSLALWTRVSFQTLLPPLVLTLFVVPSLSLGSAATRSDSYSSRVGARRISHPHKRGHPPRRIVSLLSTFSVFSDDDSPLPSCKRWASPQLRFIDFSPDLVSLSRNPVYSHHRREANEITPERYREILRNGNIGRIPIKAIESSRTLK